MNLALALRHCRVELLQHFRAPGYLVQALVFPTMFFLFFGIAEANTSTDANLIMASYATYAFQAIIFVQFTGGVAQGRMQHWDTYLRTLPASYSHRIMGWSLSGLAIGVVSCAMVTTAALLTVDISVSGESWFFLALALIYGSIAIAFVATALGYWLPPGAATPIATVIYLSLTYAGGIWTSPAELPGWVQRISPVLPTRLWGELAWASIQSHPWQLQHVLGLAGYLVAGLVLTIFGYRRMVRQHLGRAY